MWAANKGLPPFYLQLFITTGTEKWDDTSKGFGLDFEFHSIQGFVDSLILDSDQFKKRATNSSFHLQVSSSLTQTHGVSGYTVLNHFTLNCLLHAAPHPDNRSQHLTVTSTIYPYFALTVALSTVATRGCCRDQLTLFVLGCKPSTLFIHLLLSDIVFIKDANPLVEGG